MLQFFGRTCEQIVNVSSVEDEVIFPQLAVELSTIVHGEFTHVCPALKTLQGRTHSVEGSSVGRLDDPWPS